MKPAAMGKVLSNVNLMPKLTLEMSKQLHGFNMSQVQDKPFYA